MLNTIRAHNVGKRLKARAFLGKALIKIFSYNLFHVWKGFISHVRSVVLTCNEYRVSIHAKHTYLFTKVVPVACHGLMDVWFMKKRSSKRDKEDSSGNTIDLRKGKGRPVKRRMFYFQDETGRILFEIFGSGLAFTEKPHSKISMGRFQTITNMRNLQLSYDKQTSMPAIAIFQGLHPTRRVLNIQEVSRLIVGLVKVYNILYRDIGEDAKRFQNGVDKIERL